MIDKSKKASQKSNHNYDDPLILKLIEQLAKLEHDQWIYYSKDVANRIKEARSLEQILNDTLNKWSHKWIEYSLLSETDKDKDRVWALRVLQVLHDNKPAVKLILAMN